MDIKHMIGVRISEVRSRKGLTQEQLAGEMGISPKYLSSIERGKENPTLNTLINLAESLDTDIGELFSVVQIEDPVKRRSMINSLLNEADANQQKIVFKILSAILR